MTATEPRVGNEQRWVAERVLALKPGEFRRTARGWLRGGLPASSMPEGSKSADTPLVVSDGAKDDGRPKFPVGPADSMDRWLREQLKARRTMWTRLLETLRELERIEARILVVPKPLPDLPVIPCSNLPCDNILEPGRRSGPCSRCRVHLHRFGVEWPNKPTSTEP